VIDKYTVELGAQYKNFVLQVARRGEGEIISLPILREFDINPRVTLVGKIHFLQHSTLGVPVS
jgi:hypothetical protein